MKYTFLLPAYKAAFLSEAIKSITSQTITSFRLFVSDDCSPEDLKSVVDTFTDERVTYQRNEINFGSKNLVDHWNLLLGQCYSDYLIMASDDDIYAPNFLEEVDNLINKYPDVDIIHVRSNSIDSKGKELREDPPIPEYFTYEDFLKHFLSPDSILCIGNFVFKAEVLKKNGGFIKFPLAWKSDTATQIAMAHKGVANSSNALFSFRMSGINISSQSGRDNDKDRMKLNAILQFDKWFGKELQSMLPYYKSNPIRQAFRKRLEGESRSYYGSLSFKEFFSLYRKFTQEGWFKSIKNSLSFLYGWLF